VCQAALEAGGHLHLGRVLPGPHADERGSWWPRPWSVPAGGADGRRVRRGRHRPRPAARPGHDGVIRCRGQQDEGERE
jgi:hypothetical protein